MKPFPRAHRVCWAVALGLGGLAPAWAATDPPPAEAAPTALWLALGALVPLLAIAATAFAKASILLGIVRAGLGNDGALPPLVAPALALCLTLVVMAPVGAKALEAARPWPESGAPTAEWTGAASRAWPVLAGFLRAHTRPEDRRQVADLSARLRATEVSTRAAAPVDAGLKDAGPHDAGSPDAGPPDAGVAAPAPDAGPRDAGAPAPSPEPPSPAPIPEPPHTEAPALDAPLDAILAFLISELTAAFSLGVLILLPFVIVDLLVANTLTAVGFVTLPAAALALPFKLLLFVAADGWALFVRGFASGYAGS